MFCIRMKILFLFWGLKLLMLYRNILLVVVLRLFNSFILFLFMFFFLYMYILRGFFFNRNLFFFNLGVV